MSKTGLWAEYLARLESFISCFCLWTFGSQRMYFGHKSLAGRCRWLADRLLSIFMTARSRAADWIILHLSECSIKGILRHSCSCFWLNLSSETPKRLHGNCYNNDLLESSLYTTMGHVQFRSLLRAFNFALRSSFWKNSVWHFVWFLLFCISFLTFFFFFLFGVSFALHERILILLAETRDDNHVQFDSGYPPVRSLYLMYKSNDLKSSWY